MEMRAYRCSHNIRQRLIRHVLIEIPPIETPKSVSQKGDRFDVPEAGERPTNTKDSSDGSRESAAQKPGNVRTPFEKQ